MYADPRQDISAHLHCIKLFLSFFFSLGYTADTAKETGVIRMSQVDTCVSGREWALHSDTHVLSMKACCGQTTADWFSSSAPQNSFLWMRRAYIHQNKPPRRRPRRCPGSDLRSVTLASKQATPFFFLPRCLRSARMTQLVKIRLCSSRRADSPRLHSSPVRHKESSH